MWQRDHEREGFTWIDGGYADANLLSFLRWDDAGNPIAVVINFAGKWDEILNTDSETFGGSGVGNYGSITAFGPGSYRQPHSVRISVPPMGAGWLRPSK